MRKKFSFLLLFFPITVFAQLYRVPLDVHWKSEIRYFHDTAKVNVPSSYPLYMEKEAFVNVEMARLKNSGRKEKSGVLHRKIFTEHLLEFSGEDFNLFIDPLFNFQMGRDLEVDSVRNLTQNTRGIQVYGNIGKKVSFYTTFTENQSFFPKYISDYSYLTQVIPGQGAYKIFKQTGFDYSNASGQVVYSVNKNLTLIFGHDKMFIGSGYRSMFLSDRTFNYPFLSAKLNFFKEKLHYQTSYAWLQEKQRVPRLTAAEATYKRKNANFHLLSFFPVKKLEIGLFNGVIWRRWDDSTGTVDVASGFYSPVLGVGELISNSKDYYSIWGTQLVFSPLTGMKLYGQYAWDKNNESAWQVGAEWNNVLNIRNLYAQGEFNSKTTEMYTNNTPYTDYSHFGEGFSAVSNGKLIETVFRMGYSCKSFFLNTKANLYEFDKGENVKVFSGDIGYILNPNTNFQVYIGLLNRSEGERKTNWVRAGIRTQLSNFYDDF